ncbi:MAG: flagella basal body P-ring formation protein FlgA [Pseudomonadota bacterium]
MRPTRTFLCFAPVAGIMFAPLYAAVAEPSSSSRTFTDPAEIDRAVEIFTGARIGESGGARSEADRRLRLDACTSPLATQWYGRPGKTIQVECPGIHGWRIFVSTVPTAGAAKTDPVVRRGDPITVAIRGRGFTVQQSGEARESGGIGDWIAIRTARKADPIRARIERPGLAVIPAS